MVGRTGYSILPDVWESPTKQKRGSCPPGGGRHRGDKMDGHAIRSVECGHFVTYLDSLTAVSAARVTESCGVWGRKLSVHRGPRPPPHPCWARPLFSSLSAVIEKYQNSPWGKDKDPFVRRGCKYKFGTCRGVYYVC